MLAARLPWSSIRALSRKQRYQRWLSTLPNNPYIHVHPTTAGPPGTTALLSYLPSTPPNPALAIGTTTSIPPTPDSLTPNPSFLNLLHSVVAAHATHDPDIQAQAHAFASTGRSSLGAAAVGLVPQARPSRQRRNAAAGTAAGVTSSDTDPPSAQPNPGGWVHVSDQRNPPDWGRIAWPEDILGSLQVDGEGAFVGLQGSYQPSGTYRVITRDGILGLSPYLRERLVEELKRLEKEASLES